MPTLQQKPQPMLPGLYQVLSSSIPAPEPAEGHHTGSHHDGSPRRTLARCPLSNCVGDIPRMTSVLWASVSSALHQSSAPSPLDTVKERELTPLSSPEKSGGKCMSLTSKSCLDLSVIVKRSALSFPKWHCSEFTCGKGGPTVRTILYQRSLRLGSEISHLGYSAVECLAFSLKAWPRTTSTALKPTWRLWSHGQDLR